MEQHDVPARVARRRDGEETGRQFDRIAAVEDPLGIGLRSQFQPVDDALRVEARGVLIGVGHVIAMRQEDMPDAAQLFEAAGQVLDEAR